MKHSLDDLAIFGGVPSFHESLHVGRPNLGNRQRLMERINDLLDRRYLTNGGPYVEEFERRIADFVGVKHCIAICNGTVALQIVIRAAGLTGEVIVPSFTFIATAHAVEWQGVTPIFCDVDSETCNLDPKRIEALITPRTTGIIGVHLWGRPCEVEVLAEIAQRRKLKLIYDAAHALGCSYKGKMIGNFGDAEVFSFHATKFVNAFEGGAIITNNDELARKAQLMRSFGFADYDTVVDVGINGKMSEISAAMGLTSLESLDEFVAVNRQNYACYSEQLKDIPGISVFSYDETEKCNFQYVVLEIDETVTGFSRDQLHAVLWAENVLARKYFFPGCHRMEPYRSNFPDIGRRLPVTEQLSMRALCLPTGTSIAPGYINKISQIIRLVVQQPRAVAARCSGR